VHAHGPRAKTASEAKRSEAVSSVVDMATLSAEIDISATPGVILDVIADMQSYPDWSPIHKRTSIDQTWPDGRPKRATMTMTVMGLTDEVVLDYEWGEDMAAWSMVKSSQQKDQRGHYSITVRGALSHVHFDLLIEPAIPLPGFLVRQIMKKSVSAATDGLKKRVESLQRDRAARG
jgi:hypothetical protein